LYAYTKAARDIQFFLNSTGAATSYFDVSLAAPVNDSVLEMDSVRDVTEYVGAGFLGPSINQLPRTLIGWQYSGINQDVEYIFEWEEDSAIAQYAATSSWTIQSLPGRVSSLIIQLSGSRVLKDN
ncbi:hypothetical protein H2198_010859, partial [Neophaeococcomyces mojaviensis]